MSQMRTQREGTHTESFNSDNAGGMTRIGGFLFGVRPLVLDLYRMSVISQVCRELLNS